MSSEIDDVVKGRSRDGGVKSPGSGSRGFRGMKRTGRTLHSGHGMKRDAETGLFTVPSRLYNPVRQEGVIPDLHRVRVITPSLMRHSITSQTGSPTTFV